MNRTINTVHFLSLFLVTLCLGPALAHLLELPNKIGLGRDEYFTVQQVYRGWALLGALILAAVLATVGLAVMVRRDRRLLPWVLFALACLVGAQAVFWIFTYPANVATENWTSLPENWERLRVRLEYSHAAGALLTLAALAALAALIPSLIARARRSTLKA